MLLFGNQVTRFSAKASSIVFKEAGVPDGVINVVLEMLK
jgi:acyl-CoA reductase-like NAD-dependent aldehyde dehydrogenase